MPHISGSNLNLEMFSGFWGEEGKSGVPAENLSEQGMNQQQTQPTEGAWGPFLESPGNFSGP